MGKFRSPPELNLKRARIPSSPYRNEADIFWITNSYITCKMISSQCLILDFPKLACLHWCGNCEKFCVGSLGGLWWIQPQQFNPTILKQTFNLSSSHWQLSFCKFPNNTSILPNVGNDLWSIEYRTDHNFDKTFVKLWLFVNLWFFKYVSPTGK